MSKEPLKGRAGNEEVRDEVVRVDYGRFEKKSFIGCTLVYAGGLPPTLIECDFLDCTWVFEGPALQTAALMASLAKSGEGGKELIFSILGIT